MKTFLYVTMPNVAVGYGKFSDLMRFFINIFFLENDAHRDRDTALADPSNTSQSQQMRTLFAKKYKNYINRLRETNST